MKSLILIPLLLSTGCALTQDTYIKVKAGPKFSETKINWTHQHSGSVQEAHIIACSIAAGKTFNNWFIEVAHDSQCFDGWPVNNDAEYSRSGLYLGYEWRF
jgi:hypothetical protein